VKKHKFGPDQPLVGKVLSFEYQRNGVCGVGFYQIEFIGAAGSDVAGRHFFGVVFPLDEDANGKPLTKWNGQVAIVTPGEPTEHWRGDHFEAELRKLIAERDKKLFGERS